jgi:hypothetical protein
VALNVGLAVALLTRSERAAAASDPAVVRARAIELVDAAGRVRAQLNVESSGEAVLRLRDAAGEVRVKLGASGDGSGLLLLDGATEPGIHMLAKRSGTSLTLTDRSGKRRVVTP